MAQSTLIFNLVKNILTITILTFKMLTLIIDCYKKLNCIESFYSQNFID